MGIESGTSGTKSCESDEMCSNERRTTECRNKSVQKTLFV